jgi:ribonuclease R
MKELKGILKINRSGFGVIECNKFKKKIKVDKKDLNLNFDGNKVTFEIINETKYTCYAKVTSLPDFKNRVFVGIIHHFYKEDIFVFNTKFGKSHLVLCKSKVKEKLNDNDFIMYKITKIKDQKFYGTIIEKFGDFYDDNALTKYLIKSFNLSTEFSKKVLMKADKTVNRYHNDYNMEIENRNDLRSFTTFTIDPNGARDLDDAISIFRNENGFKVYIHIADVSYFLKKNNAIDKEAIKRSFSVYLPKQVIRMLPPILSENYCSLLPDSDKYAVTTEVDIDNSGNVLKWNIYKSIIRSCYKFTYEEVFDILEDKVNFENKILLNDLIALKDLSFLLAKKRLKLPEMRYSEEKGTITLGYSDYTHQMIEEVMILNNILAAKTLSDRNIKYPSRHHPSPSLESNETTIGLINLLNSCNINFSVDSLQKIVDCDDFNKRLFNLHCIQRILTKATYDTDNEGHWALNLNYYSHFTSPIRRTPDLISHRLIFGDTYSEKQMSDMLNQVNENENYYQKIDFLVEKFKMIRFLNKTNAINKIYNAVIMDVRKPTIVVFIPEIFYIYSMHVADFSKEKLVYDENSRSYSGSVNIHIGDVIRLKLEKIINCMLELKFWLVKN